jgi:glycogen debranching enzyme
MTIRTSFSSTAFGLLFAASAILAQTPSQTLTSLPPIAFSTEGPVIQAAAEPEKPFTVAGERGVLLGQQDGSFEAWILPVKLLSHLTIEAEIEGYTVPIDVNRLAAEIEVRPDRTILTFAHIGFTVRQIMFSPSQSPAGTGPMVLFEFDCLHPTDFTFRFTPELRWMWPERNEGVPGAEWVEAGGFYVLHSDYPDLAGAVTIPGARPGILAPYQERPQVHPVELKLHIDPVRDHGRLFPLLMAVGISPASATNAALGATLALLDAAIPSAYQAHAESYKKLLENSVSIETPDKTLNEAFQWAVVSIEQLKTLVGPTSSPAPDTPAGPAKGHDFSRAESSQKNDGALAPAGETALVAGYFASGDSARPGFGWFFGRDALYTLFAVNGFGDFALSKSELEFLIHRQRADGKIMHEYSQTAARIDWQAFPYMYAAADSTPLFLMAVDDYVRSSGDNAFLAAHREAIEKAWEFETTHASKLESGGDSIYNNTQGTGWVESWPGGLPHEEIYLALLDQQASAAMARIEDLLKNPERAAAARSRAGKIAETIEAEYYDSKKGCYAFSRNADGSLDRATTVYPALAWWSGNSVLSHSDECLRQFASHTLQTDWGLRDVSTDEKFYDGMSYHQGSVWPLFTGWAALAEYRGGQPLAGYQMLMENANLTRAQDLGAVTELLSGDFFVPFGRSTSHQLWSSAMVITPTLRGLFGIEIDAQTKTITVNPHLPAGWDRAEVNSLQVPGGSVTLLFARNADMVTVELKDWKQLGWKLRSDLPGAVVRKVSRFEVGLEGKLLDLHPLSVEIALSTLGTPVPGSRTSRLRVVSEDSKERSLSLAVEGLADSRADLEVVRHNRLVAHLLPGEGVSADQHSKGASAFLGPRADNSETLDPLTTQDFLQLHFPPGEGWKTITVTLTW